jgi:hypothetical protein
LDAKTLSDLGNELKVAKANSAAANDFAQRNEQTPTGWWNWGPGGKIAQTLAPGGENLPSMEQDSIQLAAGSKPAAIQRLTQGEIGWLRGAAPSITNTQAANLPFQKRYNDAMIQAAAKKSFYDSFQRVRGTLAGADDAWNSYAATRFDPRGAYIRPNRDQLNGAIKAQSAATTGGPQLLGVE